jgi:hypothetical protein
MQDPHQLQQPPPQQPPPLGALEDAGDGLAPPDVTPVTATVGSRRTVSV